ncbi:MAG: alkane 1-monooxygenase [Halobacteriovoraceae bacterium]|nr:alkane 1-monooxygenase [Halobacteriovoraceae bacterium]|tara:strand:- start:3245 stop:4219 length:975 start_codon:yes stop_codon:yes gene_type:complete
MKLFGYLLSLVIPASVYLSLTQPENFSFLALIIAFGVIPILDFLAPFESNADAYTGKSIALDSLLYLVTLIHFYLLYVFVSTFSLQDSWSMQLGQILAMGISCGTVGINVAHELGHRKERLHKITAMLLLSTSLYTQFYIEHNKGHHRHVSTPKDPATARLNETIYAFVLRSMWGTIKGAFKLDRKLFYIGISLQLILIALISFFAGPTVSFAFIAAAFFGAFQLEVVNYIEHYGLLRKINPSGRYEKVQPHHSWNSNHYLGRKILFELTRHSDHHAFASKPYYNLRSYTEAPNLPAGYPAMMLLTLIPPLFFRIMNPKVQALN